MDVHVVPTGAMEVRIFVDFVSDFFIVDTVDIDDGEGIATATFSSKYNDAAPPHEGLFRVEDDCMYDPSDCIITTVNTIILIASYENVIDG